VGVEKRDQLEQNVARDARGKERKGPAGIYTNVDKKHSMQ